MSTTEYTLTVDRTSPEGMWLTMLSFYKKAIVDSSLLNKLLVIQFAGESGADTGALRKEFFEDCIKDINGRIFDGDNCRVPKKDWNFETMFEIFGMLIAHSVLQSGPGFPCLSNSIYAYLASGNTSFCFPIKSDIPLDLSTHTLLSFITKVYTHVQFKCLLITIHYKTVFMQIEKAQSNEEIGSIVDEPDNLAVLNGSSWNVIDPVTMRNKHSFVQRLIDEEVIVKRERNLKAFRQGLQAMNFLSLVVKFPSLMQPFFVAAESFRPLSPDEFFKLAEVPCPENQSEDIAWLYFKDFVTDCSRSK